MRAPVLAVGDVALGSGACCVRSSRGQGGALLVPQDRQCRDRQAPFLPRHNVDPAQREPTTARDFLQDVGL